MVLLLFIYSRVVYIFSLSLFLSPFFLRSQHSFNFWFSSYCFLSQSAISFLMVISALSFLVPLSLILVLSTSYITTRLASLPGSLQLQCHLSHLSFCCLWSSFSLHTDDGASICKSLEKTPEGADSVWWPGRTTILHVLIW